MGHWMEGDWPEKEGIERPEDAAIKFLLKVAKEVARRASIADDHDDELASDFEQAIEDVESLFESNDPRSNGWVGDDGLP